MGEAPTTPRSRRDVWTSTVLETVAEFQRHAAGDVKPSFPPWRIGYLNGLSDVRETDDAYHARGRRVRPHLDRPELSIPKSGTAPLHLVNQLAWHFDQDSRGWNLEDDGWEDEPGCRMPRGPLLVDPLLAAMLRESGVDDASLHHRISDADGFGRNREVGIRLPGVASSIRVGVVMNEVRARFDLPGVEARWSAGTLSLRFDGAPDTLAAAARGRPLADVVEHPLVAACPEVVITAMLPVADGGWMVHTSAARAEGMTGVPSRIEKRKAA